ncbi:MAG: peptide deformylase [Bacteroidetes bacterium]|nr:peptide deformylase [Bacteroidota bacterium]
MILPILAYGDPVLKKKATEVKKDYPHLNKIVEDMFETMYSAHGVGLAAPQVGLSIRIFVVDASPFSEDDPSVDGFKRVFINPTITEEDGEPWKFNEGCLSIPGIREDVMRMPELTISYMDENFKPCKEHFDGIIARIIQHEFDHLEGVLFVEKISPLRKRLIKNKLEKIASGIASADYKIKFYHKR